MIRIKNCGMKDAAAIDDAAESGAEFIGFIHYPKSARHVTFQHAAGLALAKPEGLRCVAVFVNPTDAELGEVVAFGYADYIQLHGDETPARVAEVKARTGLPVIKAVGIASANDVFLLGAYDAVADHLLLDTKSTDYGGTGEAFDWSLLQGVQLSKPWFLSGGLTVNNVTAALRETHAPMVDVSSGIEREKGVKDEAMMKAFNKVVRSYVSH